MSGKENGIYPPTEDLVTTNTLGKPSELACSAANSDVSNDVFNSESKASRLVGTMTCS